MKTRGVVTLLLLLLLSFGDGSVAKTYKIALTYDPTDGGDVNARDGAHVALENYSKDKFFQDENVEFEFVEIQSLSTAITNAGILKAIEKENVIAVVGPSYSSQSVIAGITTSNSKIPTITFGATSPSLSDKEIYPYFMRTIPNDEQQALALLDVVSYFKWNDVAVISATEPYSLGLSQAFVAKAKDSGIDIAATIYFPDTDTDFTDEIKIIQRTGARIIFVTMLIADFQRFLDTAHKEDLTGPPYVFLSPDLLSDQTAVTDVNGDVSKSLVSYWYGSLATQPTKGLSSSKVTQQFGKDMEEYQKKHPNKLGVTGVLLYAPYAHDAVATVLLAVKKMLQNNDDPRKGEDLLATMKKVKFEGVSGTVMFDKDGERLRSSYTILNVQGGKQVTTAVGSWNNDTGVQIDKSPIWPTGKTKPIPDSEPKKAIKYYDCYNQVVQVDTRGYIKLGPVEGDPHYIDEKLYCDAVIDCDNWSDEGFGCSSSLAASFIGVGAVAIFLASLVFFSILIIWRYRKAGRIRASGLVFLLSIGVGAIVGILSIFTFYGKAQTWVCVLQIWIISIPSGVLIGGLATKQYRVWRVFGNKSLKTVIVTEKQMLAMIGFFLIPDIIVLIVWSAADTPSRYLDDKGEHVTCDDDAQIVFLIILAVYKGFLLFVSSILAILTRKMPSAFSEAKLVGFALYNATLVCVIIIPIIIAVDDDFFIWIVTVLFIEFFFFSTFAILAFPKIYGLLVIDRKKSETERNKLPTYVKGGSNPTPTSTSNRTT
eukprot:TRINITY_DN2021_c0_g1_i1.p1 TRINITY_DN2021_c0_g1~~TRINITY_DN2021_c0_g1_i1.p1  ORF type:complete len:765 (+),score=173.09 TRINITY_DN2021_c0_g1_i1:211-2505(+)